MPDNYCKMCGVCCNPIYLRFDATDVEATNAPPGWIAKHWCFIRVANFSQGKFFLYDCDEFDHQTHKCRIQNFKPDVCKDFPMGYDKKITQSNYDDILNIDCGYRIMWEKEGKK